MTRILFVHNGLTRFVRIDRDLLAADHDVTEWHEVSPRRLRPWKVRRAVREHDLVFAWFASWHALPAVLWARRLGKPSVVVTGGYDIASVPEAGYGFQRGGLRQLISRTILRSATRLVAMSESARREAVANAGADPQRIVMIYPAVEAIPDAPADDRERIVLTVGNVFRENLLRKGLLPFVRSAAHLPGVRFVHAGKWYDGIDELRREATPNVEFRGFVSDDELSQLYGRASVYVQASLHEGFGLSVAEAMSAGCIPVVSQAGSLPEVVGDTGVFSDPGRPDVLARDIARALDLGPETRRAARARVLNNFRLDQRQTALNDLVHSLAP